MLETLPRRENHTRVRSTRQMTRVPKRHARTHLIELSEQASKIDKAGPQNYRVAKERIIKEHSFIVLASDLQLPHVLQRPMQLLVETVTTWSRQLGVHDNHRQVRVRTTQLGQRQEDEEFKCLDWCVSSVSTCLATCRIEWSSRVVRCWSTPQGPRCWHTRPTTVSTHSSRSRLNLPRTLAELCCAEVVPTQSLSERASRWMQRLQRASSGVERSFRQRSGEPALPPHPRSWRGSGYDEHPCRSVKLAQPCVSPIIAVL